MPDAGRTAHAPRVATAVRPAAAALLLPLLAAAFLAALWLLGGTPAHALDLHGGGGGSEADALDPSPDTDADDGASDTDPAADTNPATAPAHDTAEDRTTGTSLDTLVPDEVTGEVTAPVTDTLGSVRQRLEDPASEPDGGELSETGLPVADVGEGARRVVENLGRESGVGPGSGLTSVITGEDTRASDATSEEPAGAAARDQDTGDDRDTERDRRTSEDTAPNGPGAAPHATADTTPVWDDTTDRDTDAAPETGTRSDAGEPRPAHLASAPTTSAQAAGSAAPAVAGYLPSFSVTGPASTAVRPWSTAPHGVPADPADDPTVSPD